MDRRPPAPQAGRGDPGRAAVHGPRRLAPLLGAVAARHRAGLPVRRRAGGRRRDADLPVVHRRAKRLAKPGADRSSSARARSRASPVRRRPTTPARPACSCRCSRWACRSRRRPRRSCWPRCAPTASSPGPTLMADQPDLVWTLLGEPADRQHAAAGHQPAARAAVGQAAADPAAAALRRHPLLRLARRLQRQPGPVRPRPAAGLRRRRVRHPPVRHPGAAADPRRHPRPAHGGQDARGARPVQRRHQRALQRGAGDLHLRAHRGRHRGALRRSGLHSRSAERRSRR